MVQAVSDRLEMKEVPEMVRSLQSTGEVVSRSGVMDRMIFSPRLTSPLNKFRSRKGSIAEDSNNCSVLKGTQEMKTMICPSATAAADAGNGAFFSRTASGRTPCSSAVIASIKRTHVKLSGLMKPAGITASTPANHPPPTPSFVAAAAALNSFSEDLTWTEEDLSLVSTNDVETSACTVRCESDNEEGVCKDHQTKVDSDGDQQTTETSYCRCQETDLRGHSSLTTDRRRSSAASPDFVVDSIDSGITDTSSSSSSSSSLIASRSTGMAEGGRDRGGRTEATRRMGPQSRAIIVRGFSPHANIYSRREYSLSHQLLF